MSVDREMIRKAFTLGHKAQENPAIPAAQRNQFRAIARLIWHALDEQKPMPATLPAEAPEQSL
jgi:hypothetical protein